MSQYRKKPVIINAMQFRGPDVSGIEYMVAFDDWLVSVQADRKCRYVGNNLMITTLEGKMEASPGDWIIQGVKGEIYPCKPDIFAETYERVS